MNRAELVESVKESLEECGHAKEFLRNSCIDEMLSMAEVFKTLGVDKGMSENEYHIIQEALEGTDSEIEDF
jgi:hypothetical protein